jgi:hypothetical protein
MALGKTAGGLILVLAGQAFGMSFPMRHEHLRKGCEGTMTVDERGVSFTGAKKHRWAWTYSDIQQLKLAPDSVYVLTYKDSKLRLGKDRGYEFRGKVPEETYGLLRAGMDQRLVAGIARAAEPPEWGLPVKHLARITGSEGTLAFGADSVVYATAAKGESRTWRYPDIRNISSSGPFELTIASFEKEFHFQLKQPISEARYNEIWLQIEKKNGRIQ